jgi:tetratricopeptide (TPR) repeat protein
VLGCLLLLMLAGCHRDPNVKKQKFLESGKQYLEQGKTKEATLQFASALQLDPRFTEAHYQMARAFTMTGRFNDAYRELNIVVNQDPNHLRARVDLANLLLAGRQYDRAEESARIALRLKPDDIEAHQVMANLLMATGKPDQAMEEIQQAIALDPNRSRTYVNLAILYGNRGQREEALGAIRKAIELDPKNLDAVLILAEHYRLQKSWPEAEAQYRHAIEIAPKTYNIRAGLAQSYLQQNRPDLAERVFVEAKAALPDDSEAYNSLGNYYRLRGDKAKALAEFAALYKEHEKDPRTRTNYLDALLANDRYQAASAILDPVLKANAQDADALLIRGRIELHQQRPRDAMQSFQEALKRAPDNAQAHFFLAAALSRIGDQSRAESEWKEAARLDPNNLSAQESLATIAINKKDSGMLMQVAANLLRIAPDMPDGYTYRAIAKAGQKQFPAAEADLRKAIEIAPNNAYSYFQLGVVKAQEKDYAAAEKNYEEALQRDPAQMDALRGLAEVYAVRKTPGKIIARVDAQIARSPFSAALYQFKGAVLIQAHDAKGAAASLEKAVALGGPTKMDATLQLAQVQTSLGNLDQAAANYDAAAQLDPQDRRPYVLRGGLEELRGNWDLARQFYEKALRLGNDAVAANNLAFLLLEHGGSLDTAISLAQTARQLMPDAPSTADTLAWAYYKKGLYRMAADLLEEAVRKDASKAPYQYHLGLAYCKLGDKAKGRTHLQRALQLDPKYPLAEEARRTLAQM